MAAAFTTLSTTESLKNEPWKQPWWHAAGRDISILFWVLLIHITAAIGLVLYPLPGWPVFLGAVALVFLGGRGTTVAYARAIAQAEPVGARRADFLCDVPRVGRADDVGCRSSAASREG